MCTQPVLLGMFTTTIGKWMMGIYVWGYRGTPVLTNTEPGYTVRVFRQEPTYLQYVSYTQNNITM